jgi:muconolactone delta-isomerase
MKILALERDIPGVRDEQFQPHLKAEAARVWELYQEGLLREIYFRQDRTQAVLVLECADVQEAKRVLETLPLVRQGLIEFEIIPLLPYSGLSRLFAEKS